MNDWNSDVNHPAMYKQSLLLNIPHLREDDITNIAVSDASSRRSLDEIIDVTLIHGVYDPSTRTLVTKSLDIVTTISVRPEYYDKSQSLSLDSTYNQLVTDIQSTTTSVLTYLQSQSTYFQSSVISPVTVSSYSVTVLRSALPTSTPTSQPSCGAGYVGNNANCVPCTPGTFLSDFNSDVCVPCALDYYSNAHGSATCTACLPPFGAYKVGSTECTAYYLNYSGTQLNFLIGSFVFMFLFATICAGRRAFAVFAIMLFPAMDVTTGTLLFT